MDRYLEIHCSVMTTNKGRIENTKEMCKKYNVDGVVELVLQACHTFNVEATRMQEMCEEVRHSVHEAGNGLLHNRQRSD